MFFLVLSWIFLLLALGTSLHSMRTTEGAFRASLDPDKKWRHHNEDDWNNKTRKLNNWAYGSLLVGVGMFAVFASVNLPWEGGNDHESVGEAGAATEPAAGAAPVGARTIPEGSGDDTATTPDAGHTKRTGSAVDSSAGQ
jgi:hypothetical protein